MTHGAPPSHWPLRPSLAPSLHTCACRYCPELFGAGSVYVAVPPLYKVDKARGGAPVWAFDEAQLKALTRGLAAGSYSVQRFKGLGEMMPEQLWDTTLNPATRCGCVQRTR